MIDTLTRQVTRVHNRILELRRMEDKLSGDNEMHITMYNSDLYGISLQVPVTTDTILGAIKREIESMEELLDESMEGLGEIVGV